ncbi:MAG: hypothetical protein P8177_08480 [Gemmatimonadota bacterium]
MKTTLRLLSLTVGLTAAGSAAAQTPTDIYLLELERTGGPVVARGAPRPVTDRPGYDNQPFFTADGAILYTSIRDGQADTYRYDPNTGRTERVLRTPESEYSPTPMPGIDRFSVVRVEPDSAQRLWSFASDGSDGRLVLENVEPVGYHGWLSADRVALYVLGDDAAPSTLRVADTSTGAARVVAERIGRSIQPVPGTEAVTFTQEVDDGWWIREYSLAPDSVRTIGRLLGPDAYHSWLPDGTLLTGHGTQVLRFDPDEREWVPIADMADAGLGTVTRLAASPDGGRLAVVVDRPDTVDADTAGAGAGADPSSGG